MRRSVVVALAMLVTSCSPAPTVVATPSPSRAPLPSESASAVRTVAPSPSATPFPTPLPPTPAPITDPDQVIFSPQVGWRPSGTTVIVAQTAASGATALWAIPIDRNGAPGSATNIVNFVPNTWALRGDAGALALSVSTVGGRARLAVWQAASGMSRWLLPADPDTSEFSPVWSLDGGSLYYMATNTDPAKAGLFVVRSDGTGKSRIASPDRFGGPLDLTPDGQGIVWSRGQAGGSVDVFDLATGTNRHLEDNAAALAWRARQPRLMLRSGGCCAGRPGGALELWDDAALTSRSIVAASADGPLFGAAAWDPTGTRLVAMRFASTPPYESSLAYVDIPTGNVTPIDGTRTASGPVWVSEGIVFSRLALDANAPPAAPRGANEVAILPAGVGPARTVYKSETFVSLVRVVTP